MGYGDAVMTTGLVKKAYQKIGRPLCVGDGTKVFWSEVFEGNPKIAKEPYPGCLWIHDYKCHRPYIDYQKTTRERTVYRDFRPEPGELFLSEKETAPYQQFKGWVYIEPNVKGSYGGNKFYPYWQKVVDAIDAKFVQGPGERLRGVEQVQTPSFRHACGLLSQCDLILTTDGGLHHAAAALGKPAIVVWGGLASPKVLGYDSHINLHSGTRSCGSHAPCLHCKQAMEAIPPEKVVNAYEEYRRRLAA